MLTLLVLAAGGWVQASTLRLCLLGLLGLGLRWPFVDWRGDWDAMTFDRKP